MINPKEISAKDRLKPLSDGISEELTILDAELQRRLSKVKSYINELNLAISEL